MPGIVQVKVAEARDLPVMDRSSELTDAFVEVKLGQTFHRTEVCPKTLNPVWDSPWFKFSVNDEDLQDEPLQIKLMDYDTYTAHDAIGKVYICLNSLADSGSQNTLDGWFPIFDTLHGVRGEAHVIVKVEVIKDQHRFRQSSCGIRFFACSEVPAGYVAQAIHGFVEELVVNDDPEYQWIDRIRTPRASNEARQRIFSKLSGELKRKIGLKALEAGGNAVIGYHQCFDLEGESGIVVRGIGTCVLLLPSQQSPTTQAPYSIQLPPNMQLGGSFELGGTGAAPDDLMMVETMGSLFSPHHPPHPPTLHQRTSLRRKTSSSSSDDTGQQLQQQPSSPTKLASVAIEAGTSSGSGGILSSAAVAPLNPILSTSEFPFYTLTSLPANLLLHVGGVVSAHSVKLLDKINNPDEPETRDAWWLEVRNEIRSHAKAMGCNAVIAYTESTSICDTLCVFSAIGTAVRVGFAARRVSTPSSGSDPQQQGLTPETSAVAKETKAEQQQHGLIPESLPQCSVCHVPYSVAKLSTQNKIYKCSVCRSGVVPAILLSTSDLPAGLAVRGRGAFVQARVLDPKRKMKGVDNALQVSKQLPFLEYNLHSRLLNKMRMKGMNAIFNLRVRITVGDTMTLAIATGTAVYLECLPPAPRLIIADKDTSSNPQNLIKVEAALNKVQEENRATYNLEQPMDLHDLGVDLDGSLEDAHSGPGELDLSFGKKDAIIIEDDLSLKEDHLIDIVTNKPLPRGFYVSGSPTVVPGLPNKSVFGESRGAAGKNIILPELRTDSEAKLSLLNESESYKFCHLSPTHPSHQMLSMVAKMEVDTPSYRQPQLMQKHFSQLVEQILQTLIFKIRFMHPCLLSNVRYDVDLPDDDEIQVTVTAMATKLHPLDEHQEGAPSYKKSTSEEMIFHMEETSTTRGVAGPGRPLSSGTLLTSDERKSGVVYISSLRFIPGFQVERYLGIINLFLIRESTSIREDGGLGAFMNVFLLEGLAIARAHVTALGGNALLSYQVNDCVLLEHLNRNQAQCLLNLSGDAVLLQPEHDSTQEPVDPLANETSQDRSSDKLNLLPVPDPVTPSNQSDSTSTAAAAAAASQVSQPLSSTSEQQTAKENKSIVPKVLQKKISKLRSETEI